MLDRFRVRQHTFGASDRTTVLLLSEGPRRLGRRLESHTKMLPVIGDDNGSTASVRDSDVGVHAKRAGTALAQTQRRPPACSDISCPRQALSTRARYPRWKWRPPYVLALHRQKCNRAYASTAALVTFFFRVGFSNTRENVYHIITAVHTQNIAAQLGPPLQYNCSSPVFAFFDVYVCS